MLTIIQVIFIIFSIFAFSRVFINIRDKNLKGREAFFWLVFWGIAILVLIYPGITTFASKLIGIDRGADLILYSSLILLAYMIFRLYAKQTRMDRNITKIVRTIAIRK
jgi:small membrane protein